MTASPPARPEGAWREFWSRRGEGVWITAAALVLIYLNMTYIKQSLALRVVANCLIPYVLLDRFASRPPRDFGLDFRDVRAQVRWGLAAYGLLLPLIAVFSQLPEFQAHYAAPGDGAAFVHVQLVVYPVQYLGWEFLLRGFLLFGLAHQFGWWAVVLEEIIIFPLAHIGKPTLEIVFSAYAGLVFSVAAYRSRSFLPALASHWAAATTLDTILFVQRWGWGPIVSALRGG